MYTIHNRQHLLDAIDQYLLCTSVAPGFSPLHLNTTREIIRFVVSVSQEHNPESPFIETLNHYIQELNAWEQVFCGTNNLAYTLLAMRIQKELRRFKDEYLIK